MGKKPDPGEVLGGEPVERLEACVSAALRRRPAHEAHVGGALRALSPFSGRLQNVIAETVDVLSKRGSFDRPLYGATVRSLAESDGRASAAVLCEALATDEAGGLSTLSASSFVDDRALSAALAKVAASRHPHLAFAAEIARLSRGECESQHIEAIAPKIKESHRIALCEELFVPLLRKRALPPSASSAIAVLRDAERHLGRWLVFAEIAARAGDGRPLEEARERAQDGPSSARAAWTLVAWALSASGASPAVRPTVELVSRLSDRPSADRDPTFLFRLAEARVSLARTMLENLVRGAALRTETGIRAALYLARDHGREDLGHALEEVAANVRHEKIRGMAAAALFDLGRRDTLPALAEELIASRQLTTMTWGALVRSALAGKLPRVMTELMYRRVQLGWVE